jgi:tRNA threonylcarbamoyladenosine biosynthesis protein TsaB
MLIAIRTDKPEAELYIVDKGVVLDSIVWLAHRQLLESIHKNISELLHRNLLSLQDIKGVLVYTGVGSFTGLRIGVSVANALAAGLGVPILDASNEDWLQAASRISNCRLKEYVEPDYGAPAIITQPKK